jgi:hypothetical protein
VAGRPKHEHDAGVAVLGQVRRVVLTLWIAIKRCFIANQYRLIRCT